MSAASPIPQPVGEPPSRSAPMTQVDAVLELESRDLIRELRLMAAGKFFGLPLSHAHAQSAVAHIDQLIAVVNEKEQQIQELLSDWLRAETARRALARELALLKEL